MVCNLEGEKDEEMNENVEKRYVELVIKKIKGWGLTSKEVQELRDCGTYMTKKALKEYALELNQKKEESIKFDKKWEEARIANFSIAAHITNDLDWQKEIRAEVNKNEPRT